MLKLEISLVTDRSSTPFNYYLCKVSIKNPKKKKKQVTKFKNKKKNKNRNYNIDKPLT